MARASYKRELLDGFARIGKAVSHPARLELLDLLAQGEKPVEVLAGQAALSISNTSNHLKELKRVALVSTRREGSYVYYRLADPLVHEFLRCLQSLAHRQLAEVQRIMDDYYEAPDSLEPVAAEELLERIRREDVLVLDVRPGDEYESGHLPGALSVPVDELAERLSDLPTGRDVVAYCRGPYCVYAVHAVEMLRSRGFRAHRLKEGVPDWRERGFPVEMGIGANVSQEES